MCSTLAGGCFPQLLVPTPQFDNLFNMWTFDPLEVELIEENPQILYFTQRICSAVLQAQRTCVYPQKSVWSRVEFLFHLPKNLHILKCCKNYDKQMFPIYC